MLAALARPSEPDVREHDGTTLRGASRPFMLAAHVRRSSTVYVQTLSPFVAPEAHGAVPSPRVEVEVMARPVRGRAAIALVRTSRARGPPVA